MSTFQRAVKTDRTEQGAVGLLSVVLLTTLVLIFMLTISLQVLLNVRNAKLTHDFSSDFYMAEGALRDARMQLKKEEFLTKTFQNLNLSGVTVARSVGIGLTSNDFRATGTINLITRVLHSTCASLMNNCSRSEAVP